MKFNIIGLLESWVKDKPLDHFHLDGYNLEFENRSQNTRGSGVFVFLLKTN